MPHVLRLAVANVFRSGRDYAVFLATLALASCLVYSFNAGSDYLLALDLTEAQRTLVGRAGDITGAFSVFVILVFAVLLTYANRFIVRRRSREFALYALLGMRTRSVAAILAAEGLLVAVAALGAGLLLGAATSPAFGCVAAFVFGVPWRLVWSFSADAALLTVEWFALIEGLAVALAAVDVCRRPLVELMGRERAPERLALSGRRATWAQAALAAVLLAVVWGAAVLAPAYFVVLILPMGWAAYVATSLVFRVVAARVPARVRRGQGYWRGLRAFTLRQLEGHVSTTAQALSCVCVLVACAACMICAGLAFSVGERASGAADPSALSEATFAPIGYVGLFYGEAFLVAAVAVLALQQMSQAADGERAYRALAELGADPHEMRASVRAQVAVSFALPTALALVHDAAGLCLVRTLAQDVPGDVFAGLAAVAVAGTLALLALAAALCARECERVVLG